MHVVTRMMAGRFSTCNLQPALVRYVQPADCQSNNFNCGEREPLYSLI